MSVSVSETSRSLPIRFSISMVTIHEPTVQSLPRGQSRRKLLNLRRFLSGPPIFQIDRNLLIFGRRAIKRAVAVWARRHYFVIFGRGSTKIGDFRNTQANSPPQWSTFHFRHRSTDGTWSNSPY